MADRVTEERECSISRVLKAGRVVKEGLKTEGRVVVAVGVVEEREPSIGCVFVVLLKSAPAPVAVFSSAVFARRVPAPTAVLKLLVVLLLSER